MTEPSQEPDRLQHIRGELWKVEGLCKKAVHRLAEVEAAMLRESGRHERLMRTMLWWIVVPLKIVGIVLLGVWWWMLTAAFILSWQLGLPALRPFAYAMLIVALTLHATVGLWPFRWLLTWLAPKEVP